ncbi:MAG: hypothetical protein ACO23N_00725 [Opitutales bacterium]
MKCISLAPVLLAAVASAQMSMPRIDTRPSHKSSVEVSYGSVSDDDGDSSGYGVNARLYFYRNAFVSVARNNVSFDGTSLDAHQFTYGIGTTEAWGQGTLTAYYAHGEVDGDLGSVTQNLFGLGYELPIAGNLTAGLTVAHTLNAGDVQDVTVTIFSLRYEFAPGFGISVSYAAQDTLLGQAGAQRTTSFGLRYSF